MVSSATDLKKNGSPLPTGGEGQGEGKNFKLLLITDWALPNLLSALKDALQAGPGIAVQHRHPGISDRQFYEEACRLRDVIGDVPLFINNRVDVALALNANLHLPERGLSIADVRPLMGGRLISASWHPPGEPREADLLLASPVYAPNSKPVDREPIGADAFAALRAKARVFALGGITAARVAELREALSLTLSPRGEGIGVAVIGEVLHAPSPARAAEALLRALD